MIYNYIVCIQGAGQGSIMILKEDLLLLWLIFLGGGHYDLRQNSLFREQQWMNKNTLFQSVT